MIPKIAVRNLSHMYPATPPVQALDDINFPVAANEFVCVIGPSGCGKTTLLRIVAGFEEPTAGVVELDGHSVQGPSHDRGVVFQADAVFPWMTVSANIEFGPRSRRVAKAKRRELVDRYVALVGLQGFEHALPKQLSGGMRKRVDLARAYANQPEVLLMDEPFGPLDSDTREKMQVELLRIWEADQKTVIFITHDLEESLFLGEKIVVMSPRPGRIVEIIDVPFAHPRAEDLRIAPEFVELRRYLWQLLRGR